MRIHGLVLAGLVLGVVATGRAAERPPDAARLARLIDEHIDAGCKEKDVKQAPLVDDALFLRRVYLDVVGTIPPITEVRDFLDNPDPNKRAKVVRALLQSEAHAGWQSSLLSKMMLPPQPGRPRTAGNAFETWLRKQIKDNTGYDRIVRQIVAGSNETAPFDQAQESKPENLAAAVTRMFLGVKIECAQCHDHPFAPYSKVDFWQQAAFFSGRRVDPRAPADDPGTITIPNSERKVSARFLDNSPMKAEKGKQPRETLAEWVVRNDNPYFARASVNRVWARYFGVGLVDPVDEFSADNPASHPKLLDALAQDFIGSGYDVRRLSEAILTSKAYQRASAQGDGSQADVRTYGRRAVQGLSAAQVFDSLVMVSAGAALEGGDRLRGQNARQEFLGRFPDQDRPLESQTSILQALFLMNGPLVARVTRPETNRLLRVLADRVADRPEECLEELYLLTLSRLPRPAEKERLLRHLRGNDGGQALGDVLWVLLNSSEFYLYH